MVWLWKSVELVNKSQKTMNTKENGGRGGGEGVIKKNWVKKRLLNYVSIVSCWTSNYTWTKQLWGAWLETKVLNQGWKRVLVQPSKENYLIKQRKQHSSQIIVMIRIIIKSTISTLNRRQYKVIWHTNYWENEKQFLRVKISTKSNLERRHVKTNKIFLSRF